MIYVSLDSKNEQKIRIGNNIVITVLKIQGEQVSLGIEAPKELQIVREELLNTDLMKSAVRENRKKCAFKREKKPH